MKPYVEVVAICDTDGECASRLATRHSVPSRYSSADEMLASTDVELLTNLTPRS